MINGDIMVIDLHNNGDILSNLRMAVQYFHRYNSFSKTMNSGLIDPKYLGYESTQIMI